MTTIDEATGLPALPEGMFWRIREFSIRILNEDGKTEHIRTYPGFQSRNTYHYVIDRDPVTPENVVERCQEVLTSYNEKVKREALYGDYPPKKFEGA